MNKYVLPAIITFGVLLVITILIITTWNSSKTENFGATFTAMSQFENPVGIDPLPEDKINMLKSGDFMFSDSVGNIETVSAKYFIDSLTKQTQINNLLTSRMNLMVDSLNSMKNELAVVRAGGDNLQAELNTVKQNTNSAELTTIKNDIIDLNRKTNANETLIGGLRTDVDTIKGDYVKTSKPITLSGTTRIRGLKNPDHTIYRSFDGSGPVLKVGKKLTDLRPTEIRDLRLENRDVNDEKLWITQLIV